MYSVYDDLSSQNFPFCLSLLPFSLPLLSLILHSVMQLYFIPVNEVRAKQAMMLLP